MRLCAFLILSAVSAVTTVPAQEIPPPPPAPVEAKRDLTPIMQTLEQALLAAGRVDWSVTETHLFKGKIDKSWRPTVWRSHQELAKATVRDCTLRIVRAYSYTYDGDGDPGDSSFRERSIFMESVVPIHVENDLKKYANKKDSSFVSTGTGWSLPELGVTFKTEELANRAANAAQTAVAACRPFTLNSSAGSPSLADTLRFIESKLGSAAVDIGACLVSSPTSFPPFLSFRRVEKIDVPQTPHEDRPPTFDVVLTLSNDTKPRYEFNDEELANRVAKAMLHAVELCGGGRKDPF